MDRDAQREMLRLVELEYERTSKFIEGTVGTVGTVRGWAVTVWLAALGVAFNQRLWELGLLGTAAILVFALVDGYYSTLYQQAMYRARDLEDITGKHYAELARGDDDPYVEDNAAIALTTHRYGMYSNLRAFRWRDLRRARPRIFFQAVYPFMGVAGLVVALALSDLGREIVHRWHVR